MNELMKPKLLILSSCIIKKKKKVISFLFSFTVLLQASLESVVIHGNRARGQSSIRELFFKFSPQILVYYT